MLRRSQLKSRRSRTRAQKRPPEKSAESFLQWLRGRDCYLDGHRLGGCGLADIPRKSPVEAAHVDHGGDKGMQSKASDRFALPLCQRHHDEQGGKVGKFSERGGWPTFEAKYGFDAVKVADEYFRAWPGRIQWLRKLAEAAE